MTDFIVIGGGIAGVSAGARLTELGTVTLLESEPALGYHASGRSAALYEASYGLPTTVALNIASGDYHREANGGYLSPRGLMVLGRKDQADSFAHDLKDLGLDALSLDEARAMVPILNPDTVGFAGYHEAAWDLDTDRMIQDFAKTIRARGGQVLTAHPVTAISRSNAGWTVTAGGTDFSGSVLVNAAGAWADPVAELAGIAPIGITPHRRSMARLPAPGGHDVSTWPMLLGSGETWYAKPDAGKWLVSPAEEDPTHAHDAWADDMVLAEGLARYEEMVTEPVTRLETSWAGLRSFSPDRALVLGPDPDTPSFIWVAGQGGYGFQTAPAASQLVADLVAGRTPVLDPDTIAALSPDRLRR
ncbi:NAD(P)/FAD-dependent oxidoreductase [Aestuariivita boseongensis]|uniref:NAD(P)/FAD-dependent oxidoreductase n=1 Tax=Aestuariivita boseongensis TaxID=1470562 RepID=UPI0006813C38|nr:FAD-binding oxidoreductase [Aestuariivita boseongensis]